MLRQPHNRVYAISVAVIVGLCAAGEMADAGNLKHAVETAEVLQTFPLGGMVIRRALTAETAVAFELEYADSSVVAAFSLTGRLLFWRSAWNDGRSLLHLTTVSQDGSTFLVEVDRGHYAWKNLILDTNGTEHGEMRTEVGKISRSGRYSCTVFNGETTPPFEVYDRRGRKLEFVDDSWFGMGAQFVSDSVVITANWETDTASVYSVNLPSGSVRAQGHWELGRPDLEWTRLMVTPGGTYAAIFNEHRIFAVDSAAANLWSDTCSDYITHSFWSDRGDWFVSLLYNLPPDSSGHIELRSARSKSDYVRSEDTPFFWRFALCALNCNYAWLTNGVISVLPTSGWYHWRTPSYEPSETLFAEFDPDAMTISEPFTARGFYKPVPGKHVPPDTYLRVLFPDTVQLVHLNR